MLQAEFCARSSTSFAQSLRVPLLPQDLHARGMVREVLAGAQRLPSVFAARTLPQNAFYTRNDHVPRSAHETMIPRVSVPTSPSWRSLPAPRTERPEPCARRRSLPAAAAPRPTRCLYLEGSAPTDV